MSPVVPASNAELFSGIRVLSIIVRLLAVLIVLSATCFGQTCAPLSLLRPVDAVTGSLGDANCRLSDGSVYAEYSLTLPTFGQLQLDAASDGFAVSLLLRDSLGRKVEEGSAIRKTIERGEYTVVVSGQGPGQGGKFTLSSAFQPEPNTICRSITKIGPNQLVDGHLLDSSCRLPNNTPYDGYQVNFLGSGTLEVTLDATAFAGQVTLRGDDGRWLASDPKTFSLTVLGDSTYTVIAAGGDSAARGDYRLTLKFTPADDETCRPLKTLLTSEDVSGRIVDDSCSFGAQIRFNYYTLDVKDAGLVELRLVPGSNIATTLELIDSAGRTVAQDVQSGGVYKPIIRQQLSPGVYSVLVDATSRVDYTLQYRFSPGLPTTCPSLELRSGTQNGSFDGASSCRAVIGMQDVYRFSTNSAGRVDVLVGSNSFDASLTLRDGKDNVIVLGADQVVADLPAGTYSLAVASFAPGTYALDYIFTAQTPGACPAPVKVPLNVVRFRNFLSAGNCRGADGQPVDYYEITTPSEGFLSIFMTSAAVDSYLTLADSQGTILRRDDDSLFVGYADAMIAGWFPAGTYLIASSASGGLQGGQYQVDLRFTEGGRPPGCLPLGDLPSGTTQSSLTFTSCQYVDDTFANIYRLPLSAETKLDITLTSAAFDSYLLLLDEKGNMIDADDNSGGGFSARLASTIEAGTYYVVLKSFAGNGYAVGNYTLAVK